jgi:UPF0716 family protein affecting phage T7 exclusion
MEVLPEIILALVTVLSPLLTAVATRANWSSKTKNAVAAGVSIVIAVVYLVLTGGISDWSNIVLVIPAVYGVQQLVYNQFLKNLSKEIEVTVNAGPNVEEYRGNTVG